jgi:hypothetical protein
MKQTVSPAVMAGIIVVVVGLIGFVGWKVFFSGPSTGGPRPAAAQDSRKFQQQYQNYGQSRPRMPGNMGSGSPPSGQ